MMNRKFEDRERNPDARDEDVIAEVLRGDTATYEILVRRYNQRIYRIVRSVLADDSESEDVMQDAFVRAYEHLASFEGRSTFATWLGHIAVHEAFARLKKASRVELSDFSDGGANAVLDHAMNPEQQSASQEAKRMLEHSMLALPPKYRVVMMMRDVEELSTAETAAMLDLSPEAVKVRLHRAHALVRKQLFSMAGATSSNAFQFHASRCDRVTAGVLGRIRQLSSA